MHGKKNTQDDSNALLIKCFDQNRVNSGELRGGCVIIQALKRINSVEKLLYRRKFGFLAFQFVIRVMHSAPRINEFELIENSDTPLECSSSHIPQSV